ncbi:MAG: hypothetical protein AAFN11_08525 [Chloroflexota bacterium]
MHAHNALYNLGTTLYMLAAVALVCVMLGYVSIIDLNSIGSMYLIVLAISLTFQGTIATVLSHLGFGARKQTLYR